MGNAIRFARIGIFVGFMCLPIACLAIFSIGVTPYGKPFTAFPSIGKVLTHQSGRTDLAAALFERSILRPKAITLENGLLYHGFGYVDTPDLVSGTDGWLFYKEQFWGGKCVVRSHFEEDLAFADALQDVAEAAGLRLLFSVAPDKATIYPERLNPAARAYWHCKSENAARWRQIARMTAPRLVDHAEPLLAAKQAHPDVQLFFATDTHWTPFAGALARRQLVAALSALKTEDIPAPRLIEGGFWTLTTDLRSHMLLLNETESVPIVDPTIEATFAAQAARALDLGDTTILHDSFYGAYADQFGAVFSTARLIEWPQFAVDPQVDIDTLIINSVERVFFLHLENDLSWRATIGKAILARNEERARRCDHFRPAQPFQSSRAALHNVAREGSDIWRTTGAKPRMMIELPGPTPDSLPCLSAEIQGDRGDLIEIFLPRKDGSSGSPSFEAGRSILIPVTGERQEIRIVLPAYVAGRQVQIAPGSGASSALVTALQTGLVLLDRGPN